MSKKFDPKAAAQRFISAANSVGPEEADSSVVEAPKRGRKKKPSRRRFRLRYTSTKKSS